MNQEWCPDHDCICYFNQRLAQKAYLVFHKSSSDAVVVYDKIPASALTFTGEDLFERKSPSATKQEATPYEQIVQRILGLPEIPNTEDENAEKHFSLPAGQNKS